MTVTLYQNMSESNVVNKVINKIGTLTGTLRDETSVLNPELIIENSDADIVWVNYIYIHEWNRYYFVNDIKSVRNNLWSFSCHVDVLSTYKNQIKNLSAIIARQESEYNLYLDDDKFLVNAQRMYITTPFPNRVDPGNSIGAYSFILSLAGGAPTTTSS